MGELVGLGVLAIGELGFGHGDAPWWCLMMPVRKGRVASSAVAVSSISAWLMVPPSMSWSIYPLMGWVMAPSASQPLIWAISALRRL